MRIAVIGAGIAGHGAALALARDHDVTIFEQRNRAGGHSATRTLDYDGTRIDVDTGFIVYNQLNYPCFIALLDWLGIETSASDMSFGVDLGAGRGWSGQSLATIFADRRNLVSPSFLRMLADILRFNRSARRDLDGGALAGLSLGEYLERGGYGPRFRSDYLVPMGAAIWSTPTRAMLDFPAESLVAFFDNHRLLHRERPRWRTVRGGSRRYVEAVAGRLGPSSYRLGAKVVAVRRTGPGVRVVTGDGHGAEFDAVVLACHSDQALALIEAPSDRERQILSAIRYRPNTVYLHRDPALMPARRSIWSAWNVLAHHQGEDITVSYWMNRLQGIDEHRPLFVTLNPARPPAPELTFYRTRYDHPQFDGPALAARRRLDEIQGRNGLYFCGAWCGYGFHEDGLRSGLDVARRLGSAAPWEAAAGPVAPALEAVS